jgi:hypothetical protein
MLISNICSNIVPLITELTFDRVQGLDLQLVHHLLGEADYETLLQSVGLFALKLLCSGVLISKEAFFDPAKGLLRLAGLKLYGTSGVYHRYRHHLKSMVLFQSHGDVLEALRRQVVSVEVKFCQFSVDLQCLRQHPGHGVSHAVSTQVKRLQFQRRSQRVDHDAGFVSEARIRQGQRRQGGLLVLDDLHDGLDLTWDVFGFGRKVSADRQVTNASVFFEVLEHARKSFVKAVVAGGEFHDQADDFEK